jgi:hypothetical protein
MRFDNFRWERQQKLHRFLIVVIGAGGAVVTLALILVAT